MHWTFGLSQKYEDYNSFQGVEASVKRMKQICNFAT